jgi:hypothetical protein
MHLGADSFIIQLETPINTGCPKSIFTEILICDYQKMSDVH